MTTIDRIGQGYDLHRLEKGLPLILAGINIPWEKGLIGHSDGDVVIHAVIDALLGAAGLDDIGTMFPDTDQEYKNIDSTILMARTMKKITQRHYRPVNVDVTVIAENPKLSPYKNNMRQNLAQMLGLTNDAVAIKAKTNETLGDLGQNRAIACLTIVGLYNTNL